MPPTISARRPAALLALVLIGAVPGPAGANSFVTVSATRNGSVVEVTGSAALADGPLVPVLQDATGDTASGLGGQVAGDLTGVSLATQADGDLLVRWSGSPLPSEPRGVAAVARFRFRAGTTDYEVAVAKRDVTGTDGCLSNNLPCSGGWLLRCAGSSCTWSATPGGATLLSRDVAPTFDYTGGFIQATVPASALAGNLPPGTSIEPYTGTPPTEASLAVGQLERSSEVDAGEMTESYTYGLVVSLAAADPDSDPASLDYATAAAVASDNFRFSGSLEVPAGHAVFAKACLGGPANCAYGRSEAL